MGCDGKLNLLRMVLLQASTSFPFPIHFLFFFVSSSPCLVLVHSSLLFSFCLFIREITFLYPFCSMISSAMISSLFFSLLYIRVLCCDRLVRRPARGVFTARSRSTCLSSFVSLLFSFSCPPFVRSRMKPPDDSHPISSLQSFSHISLPSSNRLLFNLRPFFIGQEFVAKI